MNQMIISGPWVGFLGKGLAERELSCVLAVASGHTDKEIAKMDGLSPRSIKGRIESAMFKLGVFKRSALVAEAIRLGLIGFSTGTFPTPEPHDETKTTQGILIA
ncbi:helix-turn-helix transcriptional regulator [Pseudomonas typographi]|uniref:Helix-turn-helix transcriptional regulator n=1 Tax=Pseudomonas typographi TaxID=2715964 RepID=A0ABR7Z6S4_9PSED|nr:helix-turn-helix transcriptional regulator [Pseudomonas typographi]MBD1601155.1 helix-turn-helix transcriptional regulator [Pseudomonas typographi]